ncbi:hypothetical protein DAPPUDRAFT_253766 [Daphnia pulex]|uniref:Uncharacterized protein n=1 Tax=Daphnia pulex TaxID=6669 RepID=E9H5D1_DAPPU|nr:hypothetical protein DAPPUDRAFT_253766 [Daphnia pulex]|eukprot:EFX72937.1 hypothetical protein DAPPUDRAFT_253766 [Daphnia pulex]
MPYWMIRPYSPAQHPSSIINKYRQPLVIYYSKRRFTPEIYSSQDGNIYRDLIASTNNDEPITDTQQQVFPDTESRVKSSSWTTNLLSSSKGDSNEQQNNNARFLYNIFATSGTYTNPFFKTATFTVTSSVSLTSIVNCVPSLQLTNGAAAVACRRKRSDGDILPANDAIMPTFFKNNNNQSWIVPSTPEKLIPSVVLPLSNYEQLSSSIKDDEELPFSDMSTMMMGHHQFNPREKRFLFANKDQFVVKSTITTFSFFSAVSTVTRNLINPPPAVQCLPQQAAGGAAAVGNYICVACLPAGYVVCPATG